LSHPKRRFRPPFTLPGLCIIGALSGCLMVAMGCESLAFERTTTGSDGATSTIKGRWASLDGAKLSDYAGVMWQMVNQSVPGGLIPWIVGGTVGGGGALVAGIKWLTGRAAKAAAATEQRVRTEADKAYDEALTRAKGAA
jgi:hypothetical protein